MFTKCHALTSGILFLLLFTSACGAPAATQAPSPEEPSTNYSPGEFGVTEAATEAPAMEAPASGYVPNPPIADQNHPFPPGNREPYDMFFEDYGVNPSIDTEDDHLSTFALDVDTGS